MASDYTVVNFIQHNHICQINIPDEFSNLVISVTSEDLNKKQLMVIKGHLGKLVVICSLTIVLSYR
jgi:hypothetical protein